MSDDFTPQDLGLPEKFVKYRDGNSKVMGQTDLISQLVSSDKRFSLVCMPPGGGKTVCYVSAAVLLGGRTMIVTGTRGLQDQILDDFFMMGAEDIRGQGNYECIAVRPGYEHHGSAPEGTTVDKGPCHHDSACTLKDRGCLYYDQIARASVAPFVITNYQFWMTMNRYKDPTILGGFTNLILDEAHMAPDFLSNFCNVSISKDSAWRLLGMKLPELDGDRDNWIEWATLAVKECDSRLEMVKYNLMTAGSSLKRMRFVGLMDELNDLRYGLKELTGAGAWRNSDPTTPRIFMPGIQTDWVAEYTKEGIQFSPVWAHAYAERWMFRGIKRVILTSATLQKDTGKYLGIPAAKSEYIEIGSTFAKERRPIIYIPTVSVDRHTSEQGTQKWVDRIDDIVESRMHHKGIVHTFSYQRAEEYVSRSRLKDVLMHHDRRSARKVIEGFMWCDAPAVLVSPSVAEGYDFRGDMCRFQIIAKIPFPDTRSLVMQARVKSDKNYQNYLTALKFIQQYGRGMRSEEDWCETFVVDNNWRWFMPRMRQMNLLPKWIQGAVRKSKLIPKPMKEPR